MLIFSELELFGRRLSLSHGVNIVQYLSNLTKQGHFLQFPAICLDAIRSGQGLCCSSLHLNEGRSEWGWGQRVFEDTGTDSGSVTGAERSGSGTATDGRQTDSGTGTGARTADRPQQDGHSKTAKNQTRTAQVAPPHRVASRFPQPRSRAYATYNPNTENTYCKKLYLCPMSIIIENRLTIGFALGFAYYGPDSEYDYHELTLYLGLISVIFKT